jgi:uncharacterized membrane protein YuzA (DUF378 family)
MKKVNLFLMVLFGINIGIGIMSGNLAAICGWTAALIAQIQLCNLE